MDITTSPVETTLPTPFLPISALLEGARRAMRLWPVLLLMLLGTLLSAGLLALIPALNLFGFAHRPAIAWMATGIPAWMGIDLLGLTSGSQAGVGGPENGQVTMALLGFVLMPVVGGLVSAFLYGGALFTYKESAMGFSFKRFLWGCWHWFGPFVGLGVVQAVLFFGLGIPLTGLLRFLAGLGVAGGWAAGVLALLAVILWLAIFEVARARLVLDGIRNPLSALGRAMADLGRRPLALLTFYAAALLALAAVQALFRLVINPGVPLDALLLAVTTQQIFILARLFCQAIRMAGLTVMLK